ncbi:DM13 domain-containing protein [Agromyces bauzanensis]|uniref:DM13 domain-containing protein n=1 Tax=Agromyces bauzanensis TaxID=1308924 RepID=A0A917URS6_9MICO|nr:DM13 domain-containing protein [Agromyces bauzanensis]GGJ80563.1 hypothetical protein GCM10011372_18720 [Agromyces bauzanensis]
MTDAPAPARRRRLWWWIGGGALVALAIAAALVFQPWLLFVDVRVDDDIQIASAAPTSEPSANASAPPSASGTPAPSTPSAPAAPVELSRGTLISHEHETTGTVRVIQLPDGSRQLALENLDTTNGPDVHVWLSAGAVVEGFDGWFTAGGHPYVDLGMIKGNQGNQVYDIPADVDLSAYPTVDLWCVQFAVSFGAAALAAS